MRTLAINLATRGRPEIVRETIERTLGNITSLDTKFVVSVDDDDEATIEALRSHYIVRDVGVEVSIEPREDTLGEKYNRVLKLYPDADVYLVMVDYAPQITHGFDQKILEAAKVFPDGIGVVYNWWANLSFPGINAVTRKLTDLMGYLYPPYFPYWFVDHWLDDIARLIDRISFADVRIDTSKRQSVNGQPWTQGMREPEVWATFFDVCVLERRELAFKIIDAMDEPQWRKDLLKRNAKLVEHHSVCINDNVRLGFAGMGTVGDVPERYQRAKDRAIKHAQAIFPAVEKAGETEHMPVLVTPSTW
jgi:hypothetical protein